MFNSAASAVCGGMPGSPDKQGKKPNQRQRSLAGWYKYLPLKTLRHTSQLPKFDLKIQGNYNRLCNPLSLDKAVWQKVHPAFLAPGSASSNEVICEPVAVPVAVVVAHSTHGGPGPSTRAANLLMTAAPNLPWSLGASTWKLCQRTQVPTWHETKQSATWWSRWHNPGRCQLQDVLTANYQPTTFACHQLQAKLHRPRCHGPPPCSTACGTLSQHVVGKGRAHGHSDLGSDRRCLSGIWSNFAGCNPEKTSNKKHQKTLNLVQITWTRHVDGVGLLHIDHLWWLGHRHWHAFRHGHLRGRRVATQQERPNGHGPGFRTCFTTVGPGTCTCTYCGGLGTW